MALSIKTAAADELARGLARPTGESITEAVAVVLRERLTRERARHAASTGLAARVIALVEQLRAAEDLDRFLDEAEIGLAAIDVPQAREAPPLFVGDDFGTTGVIAAFGPDPA